MDSFLNLVKAQSAQIDQGWAQPRLGVVASVDPATCTARVIVQPEGVLSGWLPILSSWIGAGWGMTCPPSPGDQVLLNWQEGDAEQGIILGCLWSTVASTPQTPVGELWLTHKTGSFLKLQNDGSIASSAAVWSHTGDLHVRGDVYDQHGSLSMFRQHFNEHVHSPSDVTPLPQD